MSISCPKCRNRPMHPLADDVRAAAGVEQSLQCRGCRGIWLTKGDVGRIGVEVHDNPPSELGSLSRNADHRPGLCPYHGRILIRARIPVDPVFYLDRCPICLGIFFDAGELRRVRSAALFQDVGRFWNATVQRELDLAVFDEMYQDRLIAEFGPDGVRALEQAARVLAAAGSQGLGLAYLLSCVRGARNVRE